MQGRHCDGLEEIFVEGDEAKEMVFVASGNLDYFRSGTHKARRLRKGDWVGEAVLWMPWKHRGQLIAVYSSEIVVLNAKSFHALMEKGDELGWVLGPLREYAQLAAKHFTKQGDEVSDFWEIEEAEEHACTAFDQWLEEGMSMTLGEH